MDLEAKLIAGAAILIAVLGLGALGYRAAYDSGKTAGANGVQTQWDVDKAAIAKATATAIAQMTKQRDDALNANEAIHDTYETELSAANANASSLAQRLRRYQARIATGSSSMPKAGSASGTAPAAASRSLGSLDDATGAALSECAAVRAGYKALIAEITPQL